MCFSSKHNDIVNYRVDRMARVQLENAPADERAVIHAVDVADYTEQAFKMYNGKIESITLSFSRDLIGVIYDKFGENTEIWQEDGRYAANVKVQIKPTFWGWLFQFWGENAPSRACGLAERNGATVESPCGQNQYLAS